MRTFLKGGEYSYKSDNGHRSGLEDKIAQQIKNHGESEVYEKTEIKYVIPESQHTYTPDFVLSNGIIVEAKGIFDSDDRKKHLLIKKQFPHLDIRFVFSSLTTKICKGSNTTVAKWCEKYGYKYASKFIPDSWFREEKKDTTGLVPKKRK